MQALLGRVPQHRKEVTRRAHQDEHVPHEMAVPHAFRRVERDASSVREVPRDEPQPATPPARKVGIGTRPLCKGYGRRPLVPWLS